MAEVKFTYEGNNINIQCNINDKIKDIIKKFLRKIKKENVNLYYIYNGNEINEELTFYEQANQLDKNRKEMNVIVYNNNFKEQYKKNEIISKDIICFYCKENCLIDFKNFKITFNKCKNNHNYNDILLNYFELTQTVDLNEIKCDICNNQNKGITHNNEFYICNNCNKNICPLCKSIHDKNHYIINYDDKNYICKKHNDIFYKFCKTCNENICIVCEREHMYHNILDLSNILIKKDDFNKILKDLEISINKYKSKINIIKEIFGKMINILDLYFKINKEIISNYNTNKRNYNNLLNIYNLKNNNEILIKDLNNIIKNDNFNDIFNYSFDNFYNENGEKYIGELKNGLKDGKGILYYNKNDKAKRKKYEGYFKNDKREGKGILFWINGEKYEGESKNGKREGNGIMYYPNGDRYQGEYKNDKKEGKGIYYYKNGDKFVGDYKNGIREGKGILYYINGEKYEGDYKNGIREGKGIYYWNNGNRYEGDLKNGLREGKGIMYWNTGDRYEGDWKNSKKEGTGILYYNNGEKYEGEYKNDKKEGKGIYYWNNGNKYAGDWKNGLREGEGIMYYNGGKRVIGDWRKDCLKRVF